MPISIGRHCSRVACVVLLALSGATAAHAQPRVGRDSATRWTRLGRDVLYVSATSVGFAAWDQVNDDPHEWDRGWHGYERRLASNVGKAVIQETVTQGVAALMNRPLDYESCKCGSAGVRVRRAIRGAIADPMPDGTRPLAVPRIAGAYTGAYAQASWRPGGNRAMTTLVNGSVSLGIGALINLFYEFR